MKPPAQQLVDAVAKVAGRTGTPIDPVTMSLTLQALGLTPNQQPGTSTNNTQKPGIYNRLKDAMAYAIAGVGPLNWFGPWQPMVPNADKPEQGSIGRQFDYEVGQNLKIPPRAGEQIGFPMLRALAENYDLMRLAIETCKDQIESFEWEIVSEDPAQEASPDEIKRVFEFWQQPDKEHNWSQWLRMVVEDMLVIDAVVVFPTPTRDGNLYSLDLVDGGTIKRLIDEYGRTPMPPSPAYQQVLKGIPAVNYSREDLVYAVRNPRTHKLYGYSPVEQVITTVNIAMRRQLHQLQFYTEGNIPEAIVSLPDGWTSAQIKDFQDWWDQMLEGNTAQRRHMKFVPETKQIVFPKEGVLKDDYDEWLARLICWAFSIPANALIKQQNRATSEQQAMTAKEEGQLPRLRWIAELINSLNKRCLNTKGVKFAWKMSVETDPVQKAEADTKYVTAKVLTPDEVRETLGRDPLTDDQRALAFPVAVAPTTVAAGIGPSGFPLPDALKQQADAQQAVKDNAEAMANAPKIVAAPNGIGDSKGGNGAGNGKGPVPPTKGAQPQKGSTDNPVGKYLGAMMRPHICKASPTLTNVAKAVARKGPGLTRKVHAVLEKKKKGVIEHALILLSTKGLVKADDTDEEVAKIVAQLELEGISIEIIDELTPEIQSIYLMGGKVGLDQVKFDETTAIVEQMDKAALEYAQERSAELVKGLTDTTRDYMQTQIAGAIEQGMSTDELAAYLQDSFAFSDSRAETIARTELADAHVQGNVQGWKETGQVEGKRWLLGDNHDIEDECDECAESEAIPLDDDFQTSAGPIDFPPAHPNCVCDVVPVLVGEMPADDDTATDSNTSTDEGDD